MNPQVPGDHTRVAQQPVDLFDRRLGDEPPRRRERLANQGHRQRSPGHDPERSVGQRQDALGVQVVNEHAAQKFINEINSLLRHPHKFPTSADSLSSGSRNRKFRRFRVLKNEGIPELCPTSPPNTEK
jgi:hypothetical protein